MSDQIAPDPHATPMRGAVGGDVSNLGDAVAAFNPTERRQGKTIIRARP